MPAIRLLAVLLLVAAAPLSALTPLKRLPGEPRLPRDQDECVEVLRTFEADSTKGPYTPPQVLKIVLPDYFAREDSVTVRYLVAITGRVDSVQVTGTTNAGFIAAIARTASGYRFRPANVDGCVVAAWYQTMMYSPRGPQD